MRETKKRFCREYIIDNNGTQAAIRSGYSARTAESQASRLLTDVRVKAYIAELREKLNTKLEITAEKVIQEIAKIAFFDPSKLYNDDGTVKELSELDDNTRAVISECGLVGVGKGITAEVIRYMKTYDKQKALDQLGRHLGMFTDNTKIEHSGQILKRIVNVNPTKKKAKK